MKRIASIVAFVALLSGIGMTQANQNNFPGTGGGTTIGGTSNPGWPVTTTGSGASATPLYQDATKFTAGSDACARANLAFGQTINGVNSMIVDSRGELTNGQPCVTPPIMATGGQWLLPMGGLQLSTPFFLQGKSEIWGPCIGYDIAHCAVMQALNSAWNPGGIGGMGGLVSTCNGGVYSAGCTYYRGATVTNGGLTWYALENNFTGQPADTSHGLFWTLASAFPSPIVEVQPKQNLNGTVESARIHDLGFDCQFFPTTNVITDGCGAFLDTFGAEQLGGDAWKIRNPTVFGIWLDSPTAGNVGPFGPGTIGYDVIGGANTNQNACKTAVANGGIGSSQTYSTQSAAVTTVVGSTVGNNTLLSFTLGAPTTVWVGELLDLVNTTGNLGSFPLSNIPAGLTEEATSTNTHGFYMVWSVQDTTHFVALTGANYATENCSAGTCGATATANFFPIPLNVSYDGSGQGPITRGFYNWTVNSTTCHLLAGKNYSNFPPLGFQFGMGNSPLYNSHVEGHRVGACVSCFGTTQMQQIINFQPITNTFLGILIDNKFSSAGTVAAAGVDLVNIPCGTGGALPDVYCIVDLINNNKITSANNPLVKRYWLDLTGTAFMEGSVGCPDMTNGWCLTSTGWVRYLGGKIQPPSPLTSGTSSIMVAPAGMFLCTGPCTVTLPVPVAGYQFCVYNGDNVASVITLAALGSSARYENTARTAYGTAGAGTFVSGGAVKDSVCVVGLDATHYITSNFNGTWTAN